ncbi:phage portal protein [Methylocystis suflitae]|uniref:phage portal protein n=1 Tax=Methylocystis suflitae TaxID=2951405 RepID=UPI00210D8712|nr:phage portal protein [Methylocystis suflitae]MCQ4191021.1 phage portal protein [Methylocystis suflitae]
MFERITRAFRAGARAYRGYDAAGQSGRWPVAATMASPLQSALNARRTLAQRASYLASNSPYIRAIVENSVTGFCGDGPTLQHDNERVIAAWNLFWSSCDAEGVSNFGHLLARVVRSWIIAGEAFIVMKLDRDSGALVIMLLSAEQIDVNRNEDLGDGAFITSGVEVDSEGRHVALWILPRSPDHPIAASTSTDAVRIPIEDVCHVVDPPSPGAPRGVSQLSAILTRAVETDACEDAQLAQQKVAALLCTFISDPSQQVELGKSLDGNSVSLEPATVRIIPADAAVNVVSPPKIEGGVEFQRAMIRSLAAGAQVPFELVSADLSQTSFSSARFGDRFFRRRTTQVQKTLLEPQFLDRVFRRFVALEVLAGRLDVDLETLAAPRWLWPAYEPLDPSKDVDADVTAVNAGFASRAEIIAKRGRDPVDVDAERARDTFKPQVQPAPTPLRVVGESNA